MTHQRKHTKIKSLQNSDPGKVLDLIKNLIDDHCADLQIKINQYFQDECEAEIVLMLEVHTERMEASIETIGNFALKRKYKIEMSPTFTTALKTGVEICDLLSNTGIDLLTLLAPYVANENGKKRMVITPIIAKPFSILVCVIAPQIQEQTVAVLIYECFLFIWPTLKKTIALEYEKNMKRKCQQLLRVARRLFSQVASLETLLQIVMSQAKQLTRAEVCCVFLVDVEKMELVETYFQGESQEELEACERRIPMNIGITGEVITTGLVINAKNTHSHPAFNATVDEPQGIENKNMLCFPIREQAGIIGVGQLINKMGDPYFDAIDEEMTLAFSIYCGVCIVHSVIYQKLQEAHTRNALSNELVMYHMKVSEGEVSRVKNCEGFHHHPHFTGLTFNYRVLPIRELPCYTLRMFTDLGFPQKFHIKTEKLVRFILYVKKGYRDVSYHNWYHAFNVAHFAYATMVNYKLLQQGFLNDLQAFMFLISALVHDIDHRGTTNSFQIHGQTALAALYLSEGSVMERHHLAQAICIINTEGCDILESLPRREYDRALLLLRDYILASDVANFFKNLQEYRVISEEFIRGNRVHGAALQALLMTAADFADQINDWGVIKKTATAVLTEFFHEADVEKSLGDLPTVMMGQEKSFIPELEIQFITTVCRPLYEILGNIFPHALSFIEVLDKHIEWWDASKPVFEEVPLAGGLSVLLSPDLDNLIEFNIQEKERLRIEAEEAAAAAALAAEAALEEEESD